MNMGRLYATRWGLILLAVSCFGACSERQIAAIAFDRAETVPFKDPRREKLAQPASIDISRQWKPLNRDGLHDPSNPWLKFKQQPVDALSLLPPDPGVGNQVLWVDAIEDGYINPRTSFTEQDPDGMLVMDMDILRVNTSIMPIVKFPHRAHTIWLDCDNCHRNNIIFKPQRYGTNINMFMVLNGEKCGQCHSAVSFPVTECFRCHSVKRAAGASP